MHIEEKVRKLREERKLMQADLARRSGLGHNLTYRRLSTKELRDGPSGALHLLRRHWEEMPQVWSMAPPILPT